MGKWGDVAEWRGPIINSGDGDGRPGEPEDRMFGHVGVVIHTAEGSYAGTDYWQRNPAADVGSHFLTAKDGRREQLIDTDDRSWCQSAGNSTWISVENEGYGSRGEALTAGQVEACARILAKAHQTYGVPLRVSNSPNMAGLGWHGMGGAAWGGHYDCPGAAIKAQLPAIVARAAQLVGGNTAPALKPTHGNPGEDTEMHDKLRMSDRDHVAGGSSPGVRGVGGLLRVASLWGGSVIVVDRRGGKWGDGSPAPTVHEQVTVQDGPGFYQQALPDGCVWSVYLVSTTVPAPTDATHVETVCVVETFRDSA